MAATTYHNNTCTKNDKNKTSFIYHQTQIPHFVGNHAKIRHINGNNNNYECCSKVTKENLNMQNSTKENRHHDNYILHRYLNSKYQQEKGTGTN